MDFIRKQHLPRLSREYYRGFAMVHWTLNIAGRVTGWLTPTFHRRWQLVLLHTSARYGLVCPTYSLMPDHAHLLWMGIGPHGCDQRVATEFLQKVLRPDLTPAAWQPQPFDHVLREKEREPWTFRNVAGYILDNPVRAGLVSNRSEYPYSGCCIPGYPDIDVHSESYWEMFWRIYYRLIRINPESARSRSQPLDDI